jgi:sulfonate transport system substrate-binding protein
VQTVQDLRGKKIAFNKASSAHLLLIRALEQAGLTYADIEPIFLAPPEARAAFEGGSVDAWVIWNPFLAAAQQEIGARAIVNGETVSPTRGFTLASDRFVEEQPDLLIGIIEELQTWTAWIRENKDEYSEILAQETGVDVAVWRQSVEVEIPDVTFIDEETIAAQQEVADIFYELELIPEPLDIRAASWSPNGFAPAAESTAEATATNP